MTSLKTSIKTITYLSDIGCLEIQGASLIVDEIAHEGPPDRLTVSARSADFRDEFNVKREVSWHDVTVERVVPAETVGCTERVLQ